MKPVLLICMLLALCSCATTPEISIPEISQLPAGWGSLDSNRFEGGDCPELAGAYKSDPVEFDANSKGKTADPHGAFMLYKLFPYYLGENQTVPATENTADETRFTLLQDNASLLTLQRYFEAKKELESSTFSTQEGDFTCAGGVLKFKRSEEYGMMEGHSVNFQVQVQARKADDGSLIMIWSRGPYRSNAPEKAEFVQVFYRFSPATTEMGFED